MIPRESPPCNAVLEAMRCGPADLTTPALHMGNDVAGDLVSVHGFRVVVDDTEKMDRCYGSGCASEAMSVEQ